MVTRTRLLLACLCLIAGLCSCGPQLPRVERVVLITIDTLRADHVGSYGYPRRITPWLDELAEEAVLFENAVSSSSHTGPSHASIMTGLYPKQHGVLRNLGRLPDDSVTIAGALSEAGFATAAFAAVRFLVGSKPGFEHFETNLSPPRRKWWTPAEIGVDKVLRWLEARDPGDRYFVWLHLYDPHEWSKILRARPEQEEVRRASPLSAEKHLTFLHERHGMEPGWQHRLGQLGAIDRYDAQILRADRALRRLMEALERRGELRDSLLIVTADHGEGLGSHGTSGHGINLYQEQIRVPLIVRLDGVPEAAGRRSVELVRHVDLLPTIAELTGVEIAGSQPQVEGRSLAPLLLGSVDREPRLAFAQRRPADESRLATGWEPGDVVSLQDSSFKYILRTEGRDEFFDLVHDPLELHNLIDEPSRQQEQLRRLLERMNARMVREARESLLLDDSHREALRTLGYLQ